MSRSCLFLITSVLLIFIAGALTLFNITSAEVLDKSLNLNTHFFLIKQIINFCIAIFLGSLVYFWGYKNIIRLSPLILFLGVIFLILVFVPKIGIEKNGAKRWVGYSFLSFQPSEFVKYTIPIYAIYFFCKKEKDNLISFLKFIFIVSIPLFLILLEPDSGCFSLIFVSLIVCFFLFRIRMCFWTVPLIIFFILGGFMAYKMDHVRNRIFIYINPEKDIRGRGHQPYQAKIAVGSGKLIGKGLGKSMQKLNYLPQAKSDYIAAIYAEEFGFLGILALVGIYLLITFLGFYIAFKSKEKEGFFLAAIMTFLISFQAFLNLAVVSSLLPSKGIALPLFSQGGSSLIVNIIAIFLILSVASEKRLFLKK